MNIEFFNSQISRLSETFGPQHYKQSRMSIIWRDVREFSDAWLSGVIDKMISSSRYAPLPADFSECVSIERERIWSEKKAKGAADAKQFWSGTQFGEGDRRIIFDTILKRMEHNKNSRMALLNATTDGERERVECEQRQADAKWNAFTDMLENTAKNSPNTVY